MPAAPQRRTRRIAPVAQSDEAKELLGEAPVNPAAVRSKSQARRVQAAVADPKLKAAGIEHGEDGELRVPIAGKSFRLADSIGLMALMEFAVAADEIDALAGSQLVAMYRLLKDVVHEDDWADFAKHTREAKCTDEDFADFQNAALEALAARPTEEPEHS